MKVNRSSLKQAHPSDAVYWDVEKPGEGWGNPSKRRRLVREFTRTSTVHGTSYVCSTGRKYSTCIKIIYRVLFVVCFLFVINNVTQILQDYFGKHSTSISTINSDMNTGIDEDPDFFPLYPRITICRRPFYKIDYDESYLQVVQYAMLSLGPPFSPLAIQNVTLLMLLNRHQMDKEVNLTERAIVFKNHLDALKEQYEALKQSDDFDLTQFVIDHNPNCSEFFISCHVHFFDVDCCDIFEAVITNNGVCFTVRDVEVILRTMSGISEDFVFYIDLHTPPFLEDIHSEWGFRLFFADPKEELPSVFSLLDGEDVFPETANTVKVQLIKNQRTALHTPWHGLWDTCPRWEYNETHTSDRYSAKICETTSYKIALEERCNCHYIGFETDSKRLRDCDPKDIYECIYQAAIGENMSDNSYTCQVPCVSYSYKTETSYIDIGGEFGEYEISRLKIVFDSKQYLYNEYRKTTISSLLSQIGGSLGLYLGASIITLFEIVTFTASWLWYRLVPDTTRVRHHRPFTANRHRR